jgi:hypothetical protein
VSYRIGFDMDGVLADFSAAFHVVEARLFPQSPAVPAGQPEREAAATGTAESDLPSRVLPPHELRRRREAIWADIRATPDFWITLPPTEAGAVGRLHALMLRHRWEVFFITQRPATAGDTVQRQTQRWLVEQGFDLPSVLVIPGSRGAASAALQLDYHVDDSAQNCVDVMSSGSAKVMLVSSAGEEASTTAAAAKKLGIGVLPSIGPCLDMLDQLSMAEHQPTLMKRLAGLIGWR